VRGRSALSITAALVALALQGCVGAAAEHEAFADEAYAQGRFGDALVEYRLALVGNESNAGVHRKAAAAAFRAGDLISAAEEYEAFGLAAGADVRDEAADGLVRVARAAIDRGERPALAAALGGLERVAPEAVLGGFAPEAVAVLGNLPQGEEALTVLLHAAAGAPDARIQDSLMLAYGRVLDRMGKCEEATVVYESLVRRERAPRVTETARSGLVLCALRLGRTALDNGQPTNAAPWFELAATRAGDSPEGRVAYLGLGDVRFALGDALGAIEAYEQARAGSVPGDSIYALVAQRLNLIASPPSQIP
jgi:tetratricopeptide (TPR) repeat protein